MKYLSDKRIRAVAYVLLIVFADFFNDGGATGFLIVFFQAVCAILLLYTLFSMIRDRYRKVEDRIMGTIGRFIMRIFAPFAGKMSKRAYRNRNYVIGTDSFQFIGRGKRKEKKKKRKIQKINLSDTEDGKEKVRLAYVKYVLCEAEKGGDFTVSDTPYEIDGKLNLDEDKILFDSYVGVRYGEVYLVDNETVRQCVYISSNVTASPGSSK